MTQELRDALHRIASWHSSLAAQSTLLCDKVFHAASAVNIRNAIESSDEALSLLKMAEGYVNVEGSDQEAYRIDRFLRPETGE